MESGKWIECKIVVGNAASCHEILTIGTGVDSLNRHHKAHPVRRSDLTATLFYFNSNLRLFIDSSGIRPNTWTMRAREVHEPQNGLSTWLSTCSRVGLVEFYGSTETASFLATKRSGPSSVASVAPRRRASSR